MAEIYKIVVGYTSTNCYIVVNPANHEAVLIDPGDMPEKIIDRVNKLEVQVKAILITHGHFDHIGAVQRMKEYFKVNVYAGEEEEGILLDPYLNVSKMFGNIYKVKPDVLLSDDADLEICGINFKVIYTPGHTKGGVCYYVFKDNILFSGDTLFKESVGRTDLPTGDGTFLIRSIKDKLYTLSEETIVYPGHGESTTIGHEKRNNPYC